MKRNVVIPAVILGFCFCLVTFPNLMQASSAGNRASSFSLAQALPALSISDGSVSEGDTGIRTLTFTVTLTGPHGFIGVSYSTQDGPSPSGATAPSDYVAVSDFVLFEPCTGTQCQTSTRTISITINGDTTVEPDETFFVNISGIDNPPITVLDSQGVGTIVNDDAATTLPAITIGDVSVDEGNTGTVNAVFAVSLSAASSSQVTVNYATADGTATVADNDYSSSSGTITFPPNDNSPRQISVPVTGDTRIEPDETFLVNLSNASGATIADGQGVGTIRNDDSTCTFSLGYTSIAFTAGAATDLVSVNTQSGCTWTAVSNDSWITITAGASGTGSGTVNYSLALNTGPDRTGTMTIAGQTLTVRQEPCFFSIEPRDGADFPQSGGVGAIQVTSELGCNWTAVTQQQWIVFISNQAGSGNGSVIYSVGANSGAPRTGTILIAGQNFTVNQLPSANCPSSISPSIHGFPASGGTGNVSVIAGSGCRWEAVSNGSWITITSPANGTGNGTLDYALAANPGPPRSGTMTVAGQVFRVEQQSANTNCSVPSIFITSKVFSSAGGPDFASVATSVGCNWSAVSNDSWITITQDRSAEEPGLFRYVVAPNTGPARAGTITVVGDAGSSVLTVIQLEAGHGCAYTVSPTSVDFPFSLDESRGTVAVDTLSGCEWSAESQAPWIRISFSTVSAGAGRTEYRVDRNTRTARTGTMTIAGQTITVRQPSCPITLEKAESTTFSYLGGKGTVRFSSNHCDLTVVSNAPWITTGLVSGTFENEEVQYNVAENTGPFRTGTISINDQTFTVTQFAAGFCSYAIDKYSERFSAIGTGYDRHPALLAVAAPPGCQWVVSRGVTWVHIDGGSADRIDNIKFGTGNENVAFQVDPNNGSKSRSGTIVVREVGSAHPFPEQVLMVTQDGRHPPCVQAVSPEHQAFDGTGGSFSVNVTAPPDCDWEPILEAPWISMNVGAQNRYRGSIRLDYTVDKNPGGERTAVIDFGGKLHAVTQGVGRCPVELICQLVPSQCVQESTARSFRDNVLVQSARGRGYTQLYYKFSTEAVGILMLNPMLILRSREMMERYMPVIQSMSNGEQVTLTEGDIEDIAGFLRSISEKGSPEFQQTVTSLVGDMSDPDVHKEFNITVVQGPKKEIGSRHPGLTGLVVLLGFSLGGVMFTRKRAGEPRSGNRRRLRGVLWFGLALLITLEGPSAGAAPAQRLQSQFEQAVSASVRTVEARPTSLSNSLLAASPTSSFGPFNPAKGGRRREPTTQNLESQSAQSSSSSSPTLSAVVAKLAYSTYFGGARNEEGTSIAVDSTGNIYIAGFTNSPNFPLANSWQSTFGGGQQDAFVVKLDPSGTRIIYSTYIGGAAQDSATAIAVDAAGDAYVTGFTDSKDFPVVNALQPTNRGQVNAFVVKLDPSGSLVNSTLLGGRAADYGSSVVVDSAGNVYVAGIATSDNFPTRNAIQQTLAGPVDAFIAKIDYVTNQIVYSTYFGGAGIDAAGSIAVDPAGNLYVSGLTSSTDLHTVNALQSSHGGGLLDTFVAKVNPGGNQVLYSTYLGGEGEDRALRIAVDSGGSVYIAGDTDSARFPLARPVQQSRGGNGDAFVARINAAGNQLVYSTYLGGKSVDAATAITVSGDGIAYISGFTSSTDFPTANPIQQNLAGGYDGFIVRLSPSGSTLDYSTYLGGSGIDSVFGVAIDAAGNAYAMGVTDSSNFPLAQALQTTNAGGPADLFITKLAPSLSIANAIISGKDLLVSGGGFDQGAAILINGQPQRTRNDEQTPTTRLIGKKVAKLIAPGQTVILQVRNSDGLLSNQLPFTRP